MTATLLLAHQGGWDEILLILTPIAIFAALLGLANRRANDAVRQRGDQAAPAGEGQGDDRDDGAAAPTDAGPTDGDGTDADR